LSRRTVLRGLGGVAIGLPLLDAMSARAQTASPPTRFIAVFNPCGNVAANWTPTGTETSFQLSPILAPLQPHVSKCLFLADVNMESTYHGPGEGHMMGMAGLLSGTELQAGNLFTDGSGTPAGWGGGISIDQEIAKHIAPGTRFTSLELGVQVAVDDVWGRISYLGPGQPLPPENNPVNVFNRVFAGVTGGSTPPGPTFRDKARTSVLDLVQEDLQSVSSRLGTNDKLKLDAHLTAIRSLEQRLQVLTTTATTCTKPGTPPTLDVMADSNYPQIGQLQTDLLVAALACDLTRVGTIQWSYSRSYTYPTFIGISDGHHDLSHKTDATSLQKLTTINTWYSTQFASLLAKLDAIQEGGGTLLDHTVIFWGNELNDGAAHTRRSMPFVLAGGGSGRLRPGRFLKCGGANHNNLLVSCLNACGVPATTFGNPAYCSGPLANLT
jgi:hypothetical protein